MENGKKSLFIQNVTYTNETLIGTRKSFFSKIFVNITDKIEKLSKEKQELLDSFFTALDKTGGVDFTNKDFENYAGEKSELTYGIKILIDKEAFKEVLENQSSQNWLYIFYKNRLVKAFDIMENIKK